MLRLSFSNLLALTTKWNFLKDFSKETFYYREEDTGFPLILVYLAFLQWEALAREAQWCLGKVTVLYHPSLPSSGSDFPINSLGAWRQERMLLPGYSYPGVQTKAMTNLIVMCFKLVCGNPHSLFSTTTLTSSCSLKASIMALVFIHI